MNDPVRLVNGKLKFPPLEPLSRLHTHAPQCVCPQCHKAWTECLCVMTRKLRESISDPPHQSRPWGYKGAMVLPSTHPDSPHYGKV